MGWSLSLGRISGIEIRVHVTFFLLIAWIAITVGAAGGGFAALEAVVFIAAVFACVVAHEFGHALAARSFGIGTRDVTLLPIGGVANIERIPEAPGQEILIALAGPAVNVVIAAFLILFFDAWPEAQRIAEGTTGFADLDFLTRLALVNTMLVVFNLIPAFPMDGGRVLRGLLSCLLDRSQATRLAARIGQVMAFGLGFLGLFGNPMLLFIALFVFLAASHESYAVELDEATKNASMSAATITAFETLATDATVGTAAEVLLATSQREFPVVDGGGRIRGVLTRDGMIHALTTRGPDTPVLDVMEPDVRTINRRAPLSAAVSALQGGRLPLVCVVDDREQVIGMITLENLAEYMLVEEARRGWQGRGPSST